MSCHLFILKFPLTGILSHFFCVLTEMFAFLNQNHLLQISLPYRLVFKIYSSVLMKSDCDCLKIYSICKRKTIQINRLIFLRKLAMVIRLYLHRLLIATQLRERQMILPGVSRSEVGVYLEESDALQGAITNSRMIQITPCSNWYRTKIWRSNSSPPRRF